MLTIFVTICMMNGYFITANIMIYIVMDLILAAIVGIYYVWTKIRRLFKK